MKRRYRNIALFGLLISLLLSACELPATHRYHIIFAFEQPYGHPTYPVAPLDIVVAVIVPLPPDYRPGYLPGSLPILNQVVFFVNGLEIGRATEISVDTAIPPTDPRAREYGVLFHASRTWTPPSPGLYYIQAQAILMLGGPVNGDYSDAIQVCVVGPGFSLRACVPTITPLAEGGPVPLSAPFSFPTFTSTPASARDCPAGTFFAETTHQCIPVQIVTPKPGHGGCSQYDNASACTSNGCSWDKPSSTCH